MNLGFIIWPLKIENGPKTWDELNFSNKKTDMNQSIILFIYGLHLYMWIDQDVIPAKIIHEWSGMDVTSKFHSMYFSKNHPSD